MQTMGSCHFDPVITTGDGCSHGPKPIEMALDRAITQTATSGDGNNGPTFLVQKKPSKKSRGPSFFASELRDLVGTDLIAHNINGIISRATNLDA